MRNYYDILQVPETATSKEIRRSFHRKALRLHPDVNHTQDAIDRFVELNEAYRILIDNFSRSRYDKLLSIYRQMQQGEQPNVNWPVKIKRAVVLSPHKTISFVQRKSITYTRASHWNRFWNEILDFFKTNMKTS